MDFDFIFVRVEEKQHKKEEIKRIIDFPTMFKFTASLLNAFFVSVRLFKIQSISFIFIFSKMKIFSSVKLR